MERFTLLSNDVRVSFYQEPQVLTSLLHFREVIDRARVHAVKADN